MIKYNFANLAKSYFEVLCKWDVWCWDRDNSETLQSRDGDDTKMLKWWYRCS